MSFEKGEEKMSVDRRYALLLLILALILVGCTREGRFQRFRNGDGKGY